MYEYGVVIYECQNGEWAKVLDTRYEKLPTNLWDNIPHGHAYDIATDYYGEITEEALGDGTAYLGFGGRFVAVSGIEFYMGLRLNLAAETMLSPYVTTGGGSGWEISGGAELGYMPGGIDKFNGTSINANASTPFLGVGGAVNTPLDVVGGNGVSTPGASISLGKGVGASGTITNTWSFD